MGFFDKISEGLKKTTASFKDKMDAVAFSFKGVNAEFLEELEETLIMSDFGVNTASDVIARLKERATKERIDSMDNLKECLASVMAEMMDGCAEINLSAKPAVIMVIGVNGVGKTTTIGKLSSLYKKEGKKVLLAAADTFRAAAIDQLSLWAERAGCEIVKHSEGSDPAAVIFDSISAAKARDIDVLICDTAGRLHNKKNLMNELEKMNRIIKRELPETSAEVLLVLDATTGQNAMNQAKEFKEVADITGIVLTKLDGTAKGGMVVAIQNELKIPVKYVGVGEKAEDLIPFEPKEFAKALLS